MTLIGHCRVSGWSRRLYVVATLLLALCAVQQSRAEVDTLRHVAPDSRYHFYDPRALPAQALAERFDLAAPGQLTAVTVTLGGSGIGKCRLSIYGDEGGAPVPRWGINAGEPIVIEKTHPGLQTIRVQFQKPLSLRPAQFFVSVSELPRGVVLVGDRTQRSPACASEVDTFRYQCIQDREGIWRSGPYAFAIAVEVSTVRLPDRYWFSPIGETGRSLDSLPLANRSIAWADVNNDHFVDVLAGGRLWLNQNATTFLPQSLPFVQGIPRLNLFTDIDNDSDQDILLVACVDSTGAESSWCLLNEDGGYRSAYPLSFPALGEPTAFTILNVNSDRYPDLAVTTTSGIRLLINTLRLDYRDVSQTAFTDSLARKEMRGCAWLDTKGGGRPSLWTLDADGVWRGWTLKKGDDLRLSPAGRYSHPLLSGEGRFYAGDWSDHDHDGVIEPVLVRSVTTQQVHSPARPRTAAVARGGNGIPATGSSPEMVVPFSERRASCAWADVNMDGRLDLLALTARPCRPVSLLMQQADGGFVDVTFEAGLSQFSAGPDAVWVDYDNDQKLDIATIANGRLTILRNAMEARDGFAVNLSSLSAGTTLQLMESATQERRLRYDLSIGRGQLMQSPQRLIVPAGRRNDTVIIADPSGRIETALLTALDQSSLEPATVETSLGSGVTVLVAPNPFAATLDIQVVLPIRSRVRISMVSEEGGSASVITDAEEPAGRALFTWEPRDQKGNPLPYGVYILSIEANGQRLSRKVVYSK